MEFIISYGMPYSGTTIFAKALANAIDACTVNSRAEGIWEVNDVKPDEADLILSNRWNPKTKLIDDVLIKHWITQAEQHNKQYVVEKSPPLMFHRDSLKSFLPDAREFVLVRDPIQLYLSNRKRQKVDGIRLRTKSDQLEKTTQKWTKSWCELYLNRLEKLTEIVANGVELVVYEDFVQDPDTCIANLSSLNGVSISKLSDTLKVKRETAEKIENRDKVPEEWLSQWESDYIGATLLANPLYANEFTGQQSHA